MNTAPAWISYASAIAGLIGCASGCLALWNQRSMKVLDLRLQLRIEAGNLNVIAGTLIDQLRKANQSRLHVLSAQGLGRSGNQLAWDQEYTDDMIAAQALMTDLAQLPVSYSNLSISELESILVEINSLKTRVLNMKAKYDKALAADDQSREQIHTDMMAMTQR